MNAGSTQRWIARALIVAVLASFGFWIASSTEWADVEVPIPLQGEAATNPQYALRKFLEALHVRVETRQSLGAAPPPHAVLVLTYWHWDLIGSRQRTIEDWVRAGGRLIVDPTLIGLYTGFAEFSGIEREFPKPAKNSRRGDPRSLAGDADDFDEKCEEWKVAIDEQGASGDDDHYVFCHLRMSGWLVSKTKPIWALRDRNGVQAMRVQVGRGDVTVISYPLFDNRYFRDFDRGAFFVAAAQLRRNDVVWLATEADHPSILTLVWRYGTPVVVLFALFIAAACWRNAVRFGPLTADEETARRSLAEQIRGTGWFILRLGGAHTLYAAMLRALKEAAERRVPRFGSLTPEQQVSELARHTGIDRDSLREAVYATAAASAGAAREQSRHRLYRAIATLETARRALVS